LRVIFFLILFPIFNLSIHLFSSDETHSSESIWWMDYENIYNVIPAFTRAIALAMNAGILNGKNLGDWGIWGDRGNKGVIGVKST